MKCFEELHPDLQGICRSLCCETDQSLQEIIDSYVKQFRLGPHFSLVLPLKTNKIFFGMIYEKPHLDAFLYTRKENTGEVLASSFLGLRERTFPTRRIASHATDQDK